MATFKVKLRPSSVEGRAGTIYYQIIHNREVRQLKTEYKVFASEWDDASGTIATANIKSERICTLASIHERINWDLKRINNIIERFGKRHVKYNRENETCNFQKRNEQIFSFFASFFLLRFRPLKHQLNAD